METLQAIHSRRSIRKYTDAPVSKDVIITLLKAAMAAPSAGNGQPWQFVVIDDSTALQRIPAIHPYAAMAKNAPCAVMVCGDLSLEKYPGNWMLDCAAATQNLLLAAEDQGLGAVWCGLWPDEERAGKFRELVSLPEKVVPLALVVLGHPDQALKEQDRYDVSRVHWNTW